MTKLFDGYGFPVDKNLSLFIESSGKVCNRYC